MITGIKNLLDDNRRNLAGLKWLSNKHDIWHSMMMYTDLGSSVKVITREMEVYTIATVLQKHNVSYSADKVGKFLESVCMTRYGISLKNEAGYVASDRTQLAQNSLSTLDTEQVQFFLIFYYYILWHIFNSLFVSLSLSLFGPNNHLSLKDNCEIHVVNLVISCTLGIKANT